MAIAGDNEKQIMDDIRKDLKSNNRSVRALACKSLARFRNKAAAFLLISMLADNDPDVRFHAADSLVKIGEPAITSAISALGHDEWIVRKQSSDVLKKISSASRAALEALRDSVNSEDPNVRFWSIKSLCELKDPGIIPVVKKIFKGGKAEAKAVIANAVAGEEIDSELKKLLLEGLSDSVWHVRKACSEALTKIGPAIVTDLIACLESGDNNTYYWCTKILGTLKDDRAVGPLLEILEANDEERSEFAITALGEIGNSRSAMSLIKLLSSDSWTTRKTAAEALINIGDLVIKDIISAYDGDEASDDMRYWCVRIAGGIKTGESGKLIFKAMSDRRWFIRSCACHSLSQFYELSPEFVEKLFALRRDKNAEVGRAADAALDAVNNETLEELSRKLIAEKQSERPLVESVLDYWRQRGEELTGPGAAVEPEKNRRVVKKAPPVKNKNAKDPSK